MGRELMREPRPTPCRWCASAVGLRQPPRTRAADPHRIDHLPDVVRGRILPRPRSLKDDTIRCVVGSGVRPIHARYRVPLDAIRWDKRQHARPLRVELQPRPAERRRDGVRFAHRPRATPTGECPAGHVGRVEVGVDDDLRRRPPGRNRLSGFLLE